MKKEASPLVGGVIHLIDISKIGIILKGATARYPSSYYITPERAKELYNKTNCFKFERKTTKETVNINKDDYIELLKTNIATINAQRELDGLTPLFQEVVL